MPAELWAARAEVPLATPQGDGTAEPGPLLGGEETLGISGARLGTDLQQGWGFAWGNSNPFILTVPGASWGEEDAPGQQSSQRAPHRSEGVVCFTHGSRCFTR